MLSILLLLVLLLLLLLLLLLMSLVWLLFMLLLFLLLIPETYTGSLVKIGSVTAEILLTLSLCGGGVVWVCKVIFMFNPTKVILG